MSDLLISNKTILIILIVALFLCSPVLPVALSDSSFSDNGRVLLSVQTDRPSYLQGEVVKINVYVFNGKNESVKYPSVVGYSIFDFYGKAVNPALLVHILWSTPIPTFPAQSDTWFHLDFLSEESTFSWNTLNRYGRKMKVGVYTIRVYLAGADLSHSSETTFRIYPNLDAYPRPVIWGFF